MPGLTIDDIVESGDNAGKIASTLASGEFPAIASRLAALQLVGGIGFPQEIGPDIRSEIHLAVIAGTDLPSSQFVRRFYDLSGGCHIINASTSTRAGVIASAKGGSLSPGPIADEQIEFTVIENADELDADTSDALGEVLEVGKHTVTTGSLHETINTRGSVLFVARPKYEVWDEYEPASHQVDLSPTILNRVDAVVPTRDMQTAPSKNAAVNRDKALEIIGKARNRSPKLLGDTFEFTRQRAENIVESTAQEDQQRKYNSEPIARSLLRLAAAEAKYDGSSAIEQDHVGTAITLCQFQQESQDGEFDASVVSTGETDLESAEDEYLQEVVGELIQELEDEYDRGAPVEEVVRKAEELGIPRAESTIESLRRAGELYEPAQGYLRTTRDHEKGLLDAHRRDESSRRVKTLRDVLRLLGERHDEGVPFREIVREGQEHWGDSFDEEKAREELTELRRKGEAYEVKEDHYFAT